MTAYEYIIVAEKIPQITAKLL